MPDPTATRRRRRASKRSEPEDQVAPMPPPVIAYGDATTLEPPVPSEMTAAAPSWSAPQAPLAEAVLSAAERARQRVAELDGHGGLPTDGIDKYAIDRGIIPDGWDYEWKRLSVYGKEDPAYQVQLRRAGWEPVPASRHPEMMPTDWSGSTITQDGQILMERPLEITERARLLDKRRALEQVRIKEAQLNSAPNGTFERGTHPGAPVVVKKGYEPVTIPS